MKAVILAAGEGQRLWPLTTRRPKPMLPVANRPILEYVIEAVADAGVTDIVLVVGHKRNRIQTHFGDGDDWDVDISYVFQEDQLGTGHALQQARTELNGDFLVLNGDRIISPEIVTEVMNAGGDAAVAATRVETPREYGVLKRTGTQLATIEEKPVGRPASEIINAGIYRLPRDIFNAIQQTGPGPDSEIQLSRALSTFADDNEVEIVRYDGMWADVSQVWDLPRVNGQVLDQHGGSTAGIIHETAVVADQVHIHPDAYIGPNAVIRSDTTIGPNVSIGANAVVGNSVIMQDTTIEDGAVLRDCVIAANVTVGPNTTAPGGETAMPIDGVVHDAVTCGGVVGDNASIGGNVLLEPGTLLGDDTSVDHGVSLAGQIGSETRVTRG
ncbi:NTP transferase domain-containing protein [Salinarchaeum sp. IM2453]|uniref:sugar phosphate nucleotidyltransferase n=1 Tax=Salinarchaeum sp. IM2453 TaxID=2862870 RepID=UPI001C83CE19|nr:sugar phosphate nucleotidyltransferase [Salinarchaeum sp. IM2453]QZA89129.1 NTP transferase domain-containing protein [Salinarchaeum sp. IM2453]